MTSHSTLTHYGEGLIMHSRGHDCPSDLGRVHPAVIRETWHTWQWLAGGLIDRWNHYAHRVPGVGSLVHEVWCRRYLSQRGPFRPTSQQFFDIPWSKSLRPERQADYAHFELLSAAGTETLESPQSGSQTSGPRQFDNQPRPA